MFCFFFHLRFTAIDAESFTPPYLTHCMSPNLPHFSLLLGFVMAARSRSDCRLVPHGPAHSLLSVLFLSLSLHLSHSKSVVALISWRRGYTNLDLGDLWITPGRLIGCLRAVGLFGGIQQQQRRRQNMSSSCLLFVSFLTSLETVHFLLGMILNFIWLTGKQKG